MGLPRTLALVAVLTLAACSKTGESNAGTRASRDASMPTRAIGDAAPSAKPAVDAGPDLSGSWSGKYTAVPGAFYMPTGPEWSNLHFRGEDAGVGLGAGTIDVTVDALGRISGKLDGALGPLTVNGVFDGDAFAAALVSDDPSKGFAGTAVGRRTGDKVTGTLRASLPTGNVLREAPFLLDRKP